MRIDKAIESSMLMDDTTWARHANPWSFWTRVPILALLAFAIWSRVWIGWWSVIPFGLVVVWTLINPRTFSAPATLDNWESQVVLGERYWLARKSTPIPGHHGRAAMILSVLSGLSLIPLAYGLWVLDAWATFAGAMLASVFKLWFGDRMAWLCADMAGQPEGPA